MQPGGQSYQFKSHQEAGPSAQSQPWDGNLRQMQSRWAWPLLGPRLESGRLLASTIATHTAQELPGAHTAQELPGANTTQIHNITNSS